MKEYRPAKNRAKVTVGQSVRILRELQELSQNQLADASGIPQATISAIENDRVRFRRGARENARPGIEVPSGGARVPWVGSAE